MITTSPQPSTEAFNRLQAWYAQQRQQRTLQEDDGYLSVVEESGGGRSIYAYDQAGDLVSITEAGAGTVSFSYDDQRRLVQVGATNGGHTLYRYDDNNRLVEINEHGLRQQFEHNEAGQLIRFRRGDAGMVVYRYDEQGRVAEARTSCVSTEQDFDAAGRVVAIRQTLDGVCLTLRLAYDGLGRLSTLRLPGSAVPLRYEWNERGRPRAIHAGPKPIARFEYEDEQKAIAIRFVNGVVERSLSDPLDGRLLRQEIVRGDTVLFRRENEYRPGGQLQQDGLRRYQYDVLGRLVSATCLKTGDSWNYQYDARDNLIAANGQQFSCDEQNRLVQVKTADGGLCTMQYDRWGRMTGNCGPEQESVYRYDDAGQLTEVLHDGDSAARFTYDHKGRLAALQTKERTERYLYGPADELFAVTDEEGQPLCLFVRTPFGCLAEIHGPVESGAIFFQHQDERGTCHLITDERGEIIVQPQADPFGLPLSTPPSEMPPSFCGRRWSAAVGLYYFGARWYDPALGRFLTPDSYTARPDDARLVHPLGDATEQVRRRELLLLDWLKRPRTRNRYAYCGNDPVNCTDPNGHWSFGRVLLTLLGAIWTLPNTIFGLLIEITCLVGEVIRWIVFVLSLGHVSWETPGFDAAASSHLNAFALVFSGGWLGSFSSLLGITFGNVFFVYKDWRNSSTITPGGTVSPTAYNGTVSFPRTEALYEHELRHTNQYGWFGPFFHLGLPLFGVYEWDVILHGYRQSKLEQDAEAHGGI